MKKGIWPRYNARVYIDGQSGYLMVHWEDYRKVPDCMSNGYVPAGIPYDEIDWNSPFDASKRIRQETLLEVIAYVDVYTQDNFYPPDRYAIAKFFNVDIKEKA